LFAFNFKLSTVDFSCLLHSIYEKSLQP
jgi:hypothetical protein